MSEIDDLGEIADQCAMSASGLSLGVFKQGHRPRQIRCGSPAHMSGENVRIYRAGKNGKLRTICKLCDKARKSGRPTDSAQGYPL
jgi:hypothetical protein